MCGRRVGRVGLTYGPRWLARASPGAALLPWPVDGGGAGGWNRPSSPRARPGTADKRGRCQAEAARAEEARGAGAH